MIKITGDYIDEEIGNSMAKQINEYMDKMMARAYLVGKNGTKEQQENIEKAIKRAGIELED